MADSDLSVVITDIDDGSPPAEAEVALSWRPRRYDVGDTWPIGVVIVNAAGSPVDPTEIDVEFVSPDGTRSDGETLREGVGSYNTDTVLDVAGDWYVVVTVGGDYAAAETGRVLAHPLPLGA
jgi:hypothetical protein